MTPEQRVDGLINAYLKFGRAAEGEKIRSAYEYAARAHAGQLRENGDPYITHALSVAEIVCELQLDHESIIAALLHDTLEDTPVTYEDIKENFGPVVADIVDGLTKLEKIPYSSKAEHEVENLRKMFLAMSKDIRVIVIKLADRLHNIRTLDAKPEIKRREIALETMDVYSPIAHRLGITRIKWELEDLSLKFLDPVGYEEIVSELERTKDTRAGLINQIVSAMETRFGELGLKNIHLEGRVKHIYSIYRKMFMQNRTLNEVYDLYAVRVIVDTKEDCYNVLGVIHDMYRPIPGRFKDYISTPKPNMYQSLHTTLIGRMGIPFEVQIRTWEMHHIAEYGVAAHWRYKTGAAADGPDSEDDKKLGWIRSMLENQQDTDAEDFLSSFKIDMFADEVYVFTPKGDVINLPAGATPIDFAYAIHSEVGNRMTGAKVNSRIVTIDQVLENGDIVEIITTKAARGPGRDWLKMARTSQARSKIKQWYKKERRDENIEQGRDALEKELKRHGLLFSAIEEEDFVVATAKKLSFNTLEDLLAGIGYGGITAQRAANRIREEYSRTVKAAPTPEDIEFATEKVRRSESGVIVEGLDSCLVKFAHCCTPVPGDDIRGFVTRGYGVSVHRSDCENILALEKSSDTAQRLIPVSWADVTEGSFKVCIEITARDRVALIADITTSLANLHILIYSLQTKNLASGEVMLVLGISVNSLDHLDSVCAKLRRIGGIHDIYRSGRCPVRK